MVDLRIGGAAAPPSTAPVGGSQTPDTTIPTGTGPSYDLGSVPTAKSAAGGPAAGPLAGMSLDELRKLVAKLMDASLLAGVLAAVNSGDAVPDDKKPPAHGQPAAAPAGGLSADLVSAGVDPAAAQQLVGSLDQDQSTRLQQLLDRLLHKDPAQPADSGITLPANPLQV